MKKHWEYGWILDIAMYVLLWGGFLYHFQYVKDPAVARSISLLALVLFWREERK